MKITLANAGKKYYREWIFRKVDFTISPGDRIALLGPNGSGKSTLLQLISGAVLPTEGSVQYERAGKEIGTDDIYQHLTIAAPYLDLIEEFTLNELIDFHFSFKQRAESVQTTVLEETGLAQKKNSVYRYFSSGMKQRVKLALALCSAGDLLLLDEPCSNLDADGIRWYEEMIKRHAGNKVIIVASNTVKEEYSFCNRVLQISDYKK